MAAEEYVRRAIQNRKSYEDLPQRVRHVLPEHQWKHKVKEFCIEKGYSWSNSPAAANKACAGEQEYYEDLLKAYRHWHRLFPYHLAEYVCRVLRITPFKYYCDVITTALREEKSYDRIANFTAADIVRWLGIGRNEYIKILNACKAKRVMWMVNRSIARDMLPTEPKAIEMEAWWAVSVANIGHAEFNELTEEERDFLRQVMTIEQQQKRLALVSDTDGPVLKRLHRRGLLYLDVPIATTDRFIIPPLEGFVSNKNIEHGDSSVDPIEQLLYSIFVANSERMTVAEVASILNEEVQDVANALGVACRLGFAHRVMQPTQVAKDELLVLLEDGEPSGMELQSVATGAGLLGVQLGEGSVHGGGSSSRAVALVVDAEVTSYLMMGALSPGLKRHSVTLFEAGRVAGEAVMKELLEELWASVNTGIKFEGDMRKVTDYVAALASALDCIKGAAAGAAVELLRKESLAGLTSEAATRVLSHAYFAVVPITPLPPPALPTALSASTVCFGPSAEAATPWLQLALYTAARAGPITLALVAGQQLWRLPPQLDGCTHALLWPWDGDAKQQLEAGTFNLVDRSFLLHIINDTLASTALMVQPLVVALPSAPVSAMSAAATQRGGGGGSTQQPLEAVDVPLPLGALPDPTLDGEVLVEVDGVLRATGEKVQVRVSARTCRAVHELGIAHSLGHMLMMRSGSQGAMTGGEGDAGTTQEEAWLPVSCHLGIPLHSRALCEVVCARASAEGFLAPAGRSSLQAGQQLLHAQLQALIAEHGGGLESLGSSAGAAGSPVALPTRNLVFHGGKLEPVDISDSLQGVVFTF